MSEGKDVIQGFETRNGRATTSTTHTANAEDRAERKQGAALAAPCPRRDLTELREPAEAW
jgi:hypothetical protein